MKIPYVVTSPNSPGNLEYYTERDRDHPGVFEAMGRDALRHWKIRVSRKNPQPVSLSIFRISIEGGEMIQSLSKEVEVFPELEAMTQDEFVVEQEEILKVVPEDFHSTFRTMAWDRGHSAGYEEVILVLKGLINDLAEPIKNYRMRILASLAQKSPKK